MKKITLLTVLLFCSIAFAQESRLTIFSEDGDEFYVFLNGIRQNEQPVVNIAVDYLVNEYYDAKIVFADESIPDIEKRHLLTVDVDGRRGEVVYKIKNTKRGKRLRYFSFTPFQAILPPPSNVSVIHYNSVPLGPIQTTTTTTTTTTGGAGDNVNIGVGVNVDGVGVGINVNAGSSTTTTTTTTTTTSGHVPTDVLVVEDTGCYAMSPSDFSQALASIKSKSFSDSRLTMAKQVTQGNCLTANQIKQIMMQFDFEDTKLEYAKFAYGYCFNPENYWKINDAFGFESSIDELNEYIQSLGH